VPSCASPSRRGIWHVTRGGEDEEAPPAGADAVAAAAWG
jgi:hypothetical protein